ncbi:MAG: DNA topoisomerase IV subunit A [Albidovulum sp.]|nr:DNA topoisomerase IV subunit A [Albidovulum sp.]
MSESPNEPILETESLRRAVGERYLQYALSTIMNRALPDARDGLKPVHRRILFAMKELKLAPSGGFRKSAKISGDVMGNFHPHGDQAIYDALARLAQDFNMRYRLVDGQGNFGNIDGDNPAASRYTEARLTEAAEVLMEGLDEDAVDFRANYDGTLSEPVVLPASFPNLLANGASGIAVGMATNIPPHNIGELCDACLHLIKYPNAHDDSLAKIVPGPDFPTGGLIVEPRDQIRQAYRTGRGAIRLRARWRVENLGRGQKQIIVSEIPYQVQKSRLIERVADLIQNRRILLLADIRDESAEDVRIVLEPRSKNVDPAVLMESLFRQTDFEVRFSLNMNALIDGRTPKVCSLKEVLRAFLDHRRDVLGRRSRHRLGKIERRLEILEGHLAAFLNLDRVIEIIRYEDEPKSVLVREFELTDVQAEAILNMRLRNLRRLEEIELRKEQDALMAELAELHDMLGDESIQWSRISDQIKDIKKKFGKAAPGGRRRTDFDEPPKVDEALFRATVEREPITVVCSTMGWMRALKGHVPLDQNLRYKDGDSARFVFHASTTDRLLAFGTNGRFYTIQASALPGARGMGEPVRLMIDLPNEADILELVIHDPERMLLVASSAGNGFVVREAEAAASTRNGKQVLNVGSGVQAAACAPVAGDHVAVIGENRKLLIFPVSEMSVMTRGKGTRIQKYSKGGLSDVTTFELSTGLQWLDPAGRTRTERNLDTWIGKRGSAGKAPPRGFPKNNRFAG